MTTAHQLCRVESVFFVQGRGVMITPGNWCIGMIQAGDRLELRSPSGGHYPCRVVSIEMVRFAPGVPQVVSATDGGSLLLAGIRRDEVTPGMEIWSVTEAA